MNEVLKASLRHLGDEFKRNNLAYLSLTSKNERLLCGALAFRLHEAFANDSATMVVREWRIPVGSNRKLIDIAVLRHGKPLTLIEAKAAMSFDLVKGGTNRFPVKEVQMDINRLKAIEFAGESYVLLFLTHNHQTPRNEHDAAMPYYEGMRRHGVIDEAGIDDGFARFRKAVGDLPVHAHGEILAGNAFGVDVSVFYWLLRVSN